MIYKILTTLLFVVVVCGCSKDLNVPKPIIEQPSMTLVMAERMSNLDFKEHFAAKHYGEGRIELTGEYLNIVQGLNTKISLEYLGKEDELMQLSKAIVERKDSSRYFLAQFVGLRYLRFHHLNQEPIDINKAGEWLRLLFNTGSIDLDVLVDTYIAIQPSLGNEESNYLLTALRDRYQMEVKAINAEIETLVKKTKSNGFSRDLDMLEAAELEVRGNSRRYALQTLPKIGLDDEL